MRKTTVLILLLLFTISALAQTPTSFLEKRVTFTLPSHWQVQKQEESKTLGRTESFCNKRGHEILVAKA